MANHAVAGLLAFLPLGSSAFAQLVLRRLPTDLLAAVALAALLLLQRRASVTPGR